MTESVHGDSPLPHPKTARWQPLRIGIVDMFYYDDEQFWFHDGRLLLRGNNGTGKSKVLALTLPLLLDGALIARRVEPDADPKKRMEWNLLLAGAHPHSERTGYSWIEFGRRDENGAEHFVTLGIGLKAASGRGIVKSWYLTSTRRIGDLHLIDDTRTPLTQERLRDELAATGSGHVYTTREAYRRAVDELLFRLGEERYAALIDLLIQLRQPQLSKNPDERALSAALTEALAPLDQAIIADVAESFRSLEEEREGIAQAKHTLASADEFLRHYRAYARVATRRYAKTLREANSAYEWAGRDLHEAEDQQKQAQERAEELDAQREDAEARQSTLRGQEQALLASPEMKDAQRLDQASREADAMDARVDEVAKDAEQATQRAVQETAAAASAAERLRDARSEADRLAADAAGRARAAGLSDEHATVVDEELGRRILARRREQVDHVRGLATTARASAATADAQRRRLDDAEAEHAARADEQERTAAAVDAAISAYGEAVRAHISGLAVLPVTDVDDLARRAEAWANSVDGESPVPPALDAAAQAETERISLERAAAQKEADELARERERVRSEIARLEAGRDPEPPALDGRDYEDRADRAGAPLWRATDFVETVTPATRAAVEAALQSAGLLDAWIFPDGTLTSAGDVVLGPTGPTIADSLAAVLAPAVGPDDAVSAQTVASVLARIGWGEGSRAAIWVDASGGWGAGPARGSWTKPTAEFVGAGAREAHRREVLAQLRASAAQLDAQLATARRRIDAATGRLTQLRAERAAYPADRERSVHSAHDALAAARREAVRSAEGVAKARATWDAAQQIAERDEARLADEAAQLKLGTTREELDAVDAAIRDYDAALTRLWAAQGLVAERSTVAEQAAERSAVQEAERKRRHDALRDLQRTAEQLRSTYEELRATVGASVAELQDRLANVRAALNSWAETLRRLATEQQVAAGQLGALKQRIHDLEQRRRERASARDDATVALRRFAQTGLLRVALRDAQLPPTDDSDSWHVTAALQLARAAEQQLGDADDSPEAWKRIQQRLSTAATELANQMSRHGHTAVQEQRDDVIVMRVRYLQDEIDIDLLAARLEADVADRETLLSAREREILENHLVNEVAGHLHELILAAEEQLDGMNHELAARKTSTGMQLRVRWREHPDAPTGLAAARALLVRSDATWTPADREAIGEFLSARIREVRDEDPSAGWQEQLEQALDYRRWHVFVVERWQNGQWRSASGPASGGEKVLAVSVPLFAAAAAHYNSASPLAPRLIMLDEAFAGVDDDSRAKSLGLLATFDLDVAMTSEREWGCYPDVPGLAIAQLSRVEGIDAVGVTRWRWDGRRRTRQADVGDEARAGGAPADSGLEETLFT
ncbi:TIGR02680 family protein [Microbacterium album]|uniref:TIGR02680 family protein n=1 Tax=Microbacterium album TaxID=2053191 RepID=A0A917IH19_9MICO|nr:TIGR02680 family protein [Microbacterium album]GGH48317.1 hypothetical protein GCM10010921_25680 [Microbacterium album]